MRYYCNLCNRTISKGVYDYSTNHFGRALCITHQSDSSQDEDNASVIEESTAIKQKWAKASINDLQELRSIPDFANCLSSKINELITVQPKCWLLKERYDSEFSTYKSQVQSAVSSNRKALKLLEDFSRAKDRLLSSQEDIEFLLDWRTKNQELLDNYQQGYVTDIIEHLNSLKLNFQQIADEKIDGVDKLRSEFTNNISIFEPLSKSTHQWKPIETRSVTIKAEWIPRDASSIGPRKDQVQEFVIRRQCEKCLKVEKVNLSSNFAV